MNLARKLFLTTLAIVLPIMCVFSAAAEETDPETNTTTAVIQFFAGPLEWDADYPPDISGMDLNFGTRELPTDAITYIATGDSHSIRLRDARKENHGWSITVGMSNFVDSESVAGPFAGRITLENTEESHDGLKASDTILTISSGDTAVPVMSVDSSLRDTYFLSWLAKNVNLALTKENATNVMDTAYVATLTWTLSPAL